VGFGLSAFSSSLGCFLLGRMHPAHGLLAPGGGWGWPCRGGRSRWMLSGCPGAMAVPQAICPSRAGTVSTRPAGLPCPCFPAPGPRAAADCSAARPSRSHVCRAFAVRLPGSLQEPPLKRGGRKAEWIGEPRSLQHRCSTCQVPAAWAPRAPLTPPRPSGPPGAAARRARPRAVLEQSPRFTSARVGDVASGNQDLPGSSLRSAASAAASFLRLLLPLPRREMKVTSIISSSLTSVRQPAGKVRPAPLSGLGAVEVLPPPPCLAAPRTQLHPS